MLVVSVNYANLRDPLKKQRQKVSLEVLDVNKSEDCRLMAFTFQKEDIQAIPISFITHNVIRDSSKLIGNDRRLPYVWEILDKSSVHTKDVFGIINSDILLTKQFFNVFESDYDAYIFYRTDIGEVSTRQFVNGDFTPIYGGDTHEGCDAFFFKRDFWETYKESFNQDLILGETEWDTVFRETIKLNSCNYYVGRDLYHVYHDPKWNITSEGAKNNIAIWEDFKKNNNL